MIYFGEGSMWASFSEVSLTSTSPPVFGHLHCHQPLEALLVGQATFTTKTSDCPSYISYFPLKALLLCRNLSYFFLSSEVNYIYIFLKTWRKFVKLFWTYSSMEKKKYLPLRVQVFSMCSNSPRNLNLELWIGPFYGHFKKVPFMKKNMVMK
jgi:hypothetical protein